MTLSCGWEAFPFTSKKGAKGNVPLAPSKITYGILMKSITLSGTTPVPPRMYMFISPFALI